MKMFGSWKELVKVVFRTDTQEVELQPDSATTYTATRTISLPPGDSNQSLVGSASTQTLTNKTIDGDDNTLQDISISSLKTVLGDANEALVRDGSGAVVSALIANANIDASAAIDATKLADGSVSNTELQYINSLTSNAQDQIDGKVSSGTLTAHTGASTGVHGVTGSVVGTTDTQTLTNKSLVDTSTKFVDATDSSIQVEILSNGTASTKTSLIAVQSANRNITLPDSTTTLVGTDTTQSLSSKNFTDSPSFDLGLTLDHTTTPTEVAGAVRVYSKNDNKVYKKGADGIESEIGSGSGQGTLNIVDNASADSGTTGWTAATNYTVTRNTTDSPLEGVIDTCFAISTTTASSESSTSGVYAAALANPVAFQNTKLQLSMYVTTPATSLGVWVVSVYNSAGTRVNLSTDSSGVTTLPGGFNGQFTASFDSDSGATYTVSITQTTRTSANTLYATNISISNGSLVQGAVVTTSQPITITTAAFGTTTNHDFMYERVGDILKLRGVFLAGTTTASTAALALPSGFTIDFSRLDSRGYLGEFYEHRSTVTALYPNVPGVLFSDNTNQFIYFAKQTESNLFKQDTGTVVAGSNRWVSIDASIPIAEWTGSGTVNLGENDVEYAYNTSTADSNDTTSFGYGPQGQICGALTAARTKRVRFQSPIQVGDEITLEFSGDRTRWFSVGNDGNQLVEFFHRQNTAFYGANAYIGSALPSTDVEIQFAQYRAATGATFGAAGAAWSTALYWRVKKTKAGAAVGFGEATTSSLGLVKKEKTQTKNLAASNSSASVNMISFNNLTVGSLYKVEAFFNISSSGAGHSAVVAFYDGTSELKRFSAAGVTSGITMMISGEHTFTATATSIHLRAITSTNNTYNNTSGGFPTSWATITQLENSTLVTDFT